MSFPVNLKSKIAWILYGSFITWFYVFVTLLKYDHYGAAKNLFAELPWRYQVQASNDVIVSSTPTRSLADRPGPDMRDLKSITRPRHSTKTRSENTYVTPGFSRRMFPGDAHNNQTEITSILLSTRQIKVCKYRHSTIQFDDSTNASADLKKIAPFDEVTRQTQHNADRIENQIKLSETRPNDDAKRKVIMVEKHEWISESHLFFTKFCDHSGPKCDVIMNLNAANRTGRHIDAVLARSSQPVLKLQTAGVLDQNTIVIYRQLESPFHSNVPTGNRWFNWTATYRRDATIVTPYEKFVFFNNYTGLPAKAKRNYAEGKTKMAAWFVSNCHSTSGRGLYAIELQKYIQVDTYGACGDKKCRRSDAKACSEMLRRDYKFYLAFENSACVDYITEKFYVNALWNDVIPIALGARPEDYAAVAPPKSYIHVDDFESPRHLAEYLLTLDRNDDLYNEYFRWKGTGEFINTKFFCRLCAMVHAADDFRMWYTDLNSWWRGSDVCARPQNHTTWSTWRPRLNRTHGESSTVGLS